MNIFSNIYCSIYDKFLSRFYDLFYIVESANWSIKWDGQYITGSLNSQNLIKSRVSFGYRFLKNKILHFGSPIKLISKNGIKKFHTSNRSVLTWFHISPGDNKVNFISELNDKINVVHTSCEITKKELIKYGLNNDKIVVIPIGVDLNIFKKYNKFLINEMKKKLNLPQDKKIIGSFQKDGEGWGKGLKPKLIKSPDIFCNVVEQLSKENDIHILLTGPARGYVINRLEKAGIKYTYHYLKNYLDIVDFYNVLDLYLVTSRCEGGPKAITESMATGVPIVTTKVGMAPEIIKNGVNGFVCDIEDIENLVDSSVKILEKDDIKYKVAANALQTIRNYDWSIIAKKYYNLIYKKFL